MTSRIVPIPAGSAVPLAVLHRACFPDDPWNAAALERVMALAGGFGFCAWQAETPAGFAEVLWLSRSGDLAEAAANLFAMLRRLDRPSFSGIAVMPIPEHGLGLAINDRLRRAAAR